MLSAEQAVALSAVVQVTAAQFWKVSSVVSADAVPVLPLVPLPLPPTIPATSKPHSPPMRE